MHLASKNQRKSLLVPTVVVYKNSGKSLRKVKIFIHKTQFGYRATLSFGHRYYEIDAHNSSDDSIGLTLSFVPDPHNKKDQGGEHMIIVEFKLPKGPNLQLLESRNKEELELFFVPQNFSSRPTEWNRYELSK
jgi:hypothetical protein